ncbi:MAG: hypothetical protein SGI97_09730 [candidate division Zixibacteria bacterium]|nr:hypothetical protein [candidate division Zixibacteria bacterium]
MTNDTRRLQRVGLVILLILITIIAYSCNSKNESSESGKQVPIRDIIEVMDTHVDSLMAIPGVTGVAVGQLEDGTPCIQVLVFEESEEITSKVPKTIEGHPVDIIVSGEIVPLDGN